MMMRLGSSITLRNNISYMKEKAKMARLGMGKTRRRHKMNQEKP